MGNLFKFELHKLFRSKMFYIITVVSAVISLLFLLATYGVMNLASSNAETASLAVSENGIISTLLFFSKSPVAFCVLIFVCNYVCIDFENGILKNVISKGYSRRSVFTAKYFTVMIATLIITIVSVIPIFCVSTSLYGNMGEMYSMFIPQFIVLLIGIITFAELYFMFCSIFKKSAPAIILSILALLLVSSSLSMIGPALNVNINFTNFWFGGAIEHLADTNPSIETFVASTLCILIYLVATYIVSMFAVKKMEV